MSSEQEPVRTSQGTLEGDELERVECDYYAGCRGHAKWEIEAFQYDGLGWQYNDVIACQSCYDEHFELKTRNADERARRLKPGERWVEP